MAEYKEAVSGDVVKFEKAGDSIEGELIGYEESKQYPSSYGLKFKDKEGQIKLIFVSGIAIDLIQSNSVKNGQQIKIEFLGKKKTQDEKKEYNTYKVMYK